MISHASSVCVAAVSLFGLLTELSTLFNDFCKRMKVWKEHMQSNTRKEETLRLDRIGQIRWSSRGRALSKLFGSYTNQSSKFHSVLLIILQKVSKIYGLKGSVCYEAQKLSENLRKFVCMYVFIFLGRNSTNQTQKSVKS